METGWLRATPAGARVAAGAQLVTVVVLALIGAGAFPVESESVFTLTVAQAWWVGGLWVVSAIGMWQAYVTLVRKRNDAERVRDVAIAKRNEAIAARDAVRAELDTKRANQQLSDLMADQWEIGVDELLNRPPGNGPAELKKWNEAVRRWATRTLEIMTAHNCTKQDMQGVRVIGLAPMIPGLHAEPLALHAMSMFVAQLDRVADIARKYGE